MNSGRGRVAGNDKGARWAPLEFNDQEPCTRLPARIAILTRVIPASWATCKVFFWLYPHFVAVHEAFTS